VLIDSFLRHAIEVDVDAICDGTAVHIAGIMEHIEEAGIHSGDSACSLPPQSLSPELLETIRHQTELLAKGLNVIGLMNVQFAIKDGVVFLLEVNPRASRTVPFVAKATGVPVAKIAARVMAGESLSQFDLRAANSGHVAVKEAVFPFARFPGVDLILGPEMKSTGEVMGIDHDFATAFAKSQIGAGTNLPTQGRVFISVKDADKVAFIEIARGLIAQGFIVAATAGTAKFLQENDLKVEEVHKVLEGTRPNVVDLMVSGEVDLVLNTTEGAKAIEDSFSLRRTALTHNIPYYTTVEGARAAVMAIKTLRADRLEVEPLQSYLSKSS
jgi:carbamoyl-phosphate synthase large subunit